MYKFIKIEPKSVKVGTRYRKNVGDLDTLTDSIRSQGLQNPIVINPKNELVSGFRRLQSWMKLQKENPKKFGLIPAHVFEIKDKLLGELHENIVRKDFDIEEIVAIKKAIDEQMPRGRPKKDSEDPTFTGKSSEVVADLVGVSNRTVEKMENIVEHANTKKGKQILEKVKKGSLSVNSADKLIRKKERNLPKVPLPEGSFDVILCDPPVKFENSNVRGAAEDHYTTMRIDELCNMKIPAAPNAIMFLWMPSSMFFDWQESRMDTSAATFSVNKGSTLNLLLEAWDFKAKTFFVWAKDKIGTGSWHRNQHENLVIAIKGKMPTPAKLYSSIIKAARTEHSAKPEIVYEMIEKMYPKRNYLELFARSKREGWTQFGNELEETVTEGDTVSLDSHADKPTPKKESAKHSHTAEKIKPPTFEEEDESPISKMRRKRQ